MSDSVTPEMAAHQAPPSLGFFRQEHWSGLPFPSPMHETEIEVAQSCLTFSDPMDCSLPGSSIHGIFQAWHAAIHAVAKSRTRLSNFTFTSCIGEGNGNPLQCSCLKNPRDQGAWWTTIYGVAQSRTRLKRLSSSSSSIPSSIMAVSIYIPTNSARAYPFLHTLSSIYCL